MINTVNRATSHTDYKTLLTIFCPIITLIPILTYLWLAPAETALTLSVWFFSNLLVQSVLWLVARLERASA